MFTLSHRSNIITLWVISCYIYLVKSKNIHGKNSSVILIMWPVSQMPPSPLVTVSSGILSILPRCHYLLYLARTILWYYINFWLGRHQVWVQLSASFSIIHSCKVENLKRYSLSVLHLLIWLMCLNLQILLKCSPS